MTWRTMLSIHTIPSTTKWPSIWCRVLTSSPIRGPPLRVHIWWASGWRVREIHGRRVDGQQVGACRGSASRIKGSWWGWSGWSSNLLDHMVDDIYCIYIYIYIIIWLTIYICKDIIIYIIIYGRESKIGYGSFRGDPYFGSGVLT